MVCLSKLSRIHLSENYCKLKKKTCSFQFIIIIIITEMFNSLPIIYP